MSKCMTIDESLNQEQNPNSEVEKVTDQKDIDCVSEEALCPPVVDPERGCHIGDCNVTEDFSQQFGQLTLDSSEAKIPIINARKGEDLYSSSDLSIELSWNSNKSLLSEDVARENIDKIFESLMEKDSSSSSNVPYQSKINEYKVVNDQVFENNELRFENGQFHVEINKAEEQPKKLIDDLRKEYFSKEDIIKGEKIEIAYFSGEELCKIYVPLNANTAMSTFENQSNGQRKSPGEESIKIEKEQQEGEMEIVTSEVPLPVNERSYFPPITSEAVRQVWGNVSQSGINWEGDKSAQPEEVLRLMLEFSNLQIAPNCANDPNRPRACTLAEEDVKKMIKEIEEINFNQNYISSEESRVSYDMDGQGDHDIEIGSRHIFGGESVDSISGIPSLRSCRKEKVSLIEDEDEKEEPIRNEDLSSTNTLGLWSSTGASKSHGEIGSKLSREFRRSEYMVSRCSTSKNESSSSLYDIESEISKDTPVEICKSFHLRGVHLDSSSHELDQKQEYDFEIKEAVNAMHLTEHDDTNIENSETVIKIIEPSEDQFLSPSSEMELDCLAKEEVPGIVCDILDTDEGVISSAQEPRIVKSGMTTVGPMKDLDNDPKDLSSQEIDYGNLIHIPGSRQCVSVVVPSQISTPANVLMSNFGDNRILALEIEVGDFGCLVNHDIASATKLQKVREVMSHRPKPEDDLIEDVTRSRLDLKNVESVSDGRYNDQDNSLSMLAVEIEEAVIVNNKNDNSEETQRILDGNSFQAPGVQFDDNCRLDKMESERSNYTYGRSYPYLPQLLQDDNLVKAQSTQSVPKKTRNEEDALISLMDGAQKDMEISYNSVQSENRHEYIYNLNSNVQSDSVVNQKQNTFGSVFRKASNKFIRKDSDSFLRNSKSLPRDTSKLNFKLANADSLRSIIDECQSSAASVVKKSRTLLKNTHSLLKTLSQTRFSEISFSNDKQKCSQSQFDPYNPERRPSTSSKTESLMKVKNSLKNKVSKTFKSYENIIDSTQKSHDNREASDQKDLRLVLRNEKDYSVEKIENFRKLLPKSPLVYRSQFVQPRDYNLTENEDIISNYDEVYPVAEKHLDHIEGCPKSMVSLYNAAEESLKVEAEGVSKTKILEKELEMASDESHEEDNPWEGGRGDLHPPNINASVNDNVGESITSFKSTKSHVVSEVSQRDDDMALTDNSYQLEKGGAEEILCAPMIDEESEIKKPLPASLDHDLKQSKSHEKLKKNMEKILSSTPSEVTKRKKNKNLSSRFRSFWNSAFGRVKLTSKKSNAS